MKSILDQVNKSGIKLLTPLSLEQTYETVVKEGMQLTSSEFGSLILDENKKLKRVYASDPFLYEIEPRKKGFVYNAYKNQEIIVIEGVTVAKHHPIIKSKNIKCVTLIPLTYKNQSIGVLGLHGLTMKNFSDEDKELFKIFGSLSSLAIKKAQLYNETTEALALRDRFISMAAHELKTPLTAISGYAQLLTKRLADTDSVEARWVIGLYGESRKLTQSINELTAVNHIQRGQLQYNLAKCSLAQIITDAVTEFLKTFPERKVSFLNKARKNSDFIIGDCEKLQNAIISLLDNAGKFSAPETTIEIILKLDQAQLHFEIKDHGKGIEAQDLQRIYNGLYKKGDDSVQGIGLGLFLTRNIIDYHHGDLKIKSKPNHGTIVHIKLPPYKV